MSALSPTQFDVKEADYPGLDGLSGHIAFPEPFTLADFATWYNTLRQAYTGDSSDDGALIRQFKAAMSIAEWRVEGIAYELVEKISDDLPMELISWVTDCADACIAPRIRIESPKAAVKRVAEQAKRKAAPFSFKTADYVWRYPDLEKYGDGRLQMPPSFSRQYYRAWVKAAQLIIPNGEEAQLFKYSLFGRSWQSALTLITKWNVPGVPRSALSEDGVGVPLELASWVVDCADDYLGARLNLKKLHSPSAIM